MPSRENFRYFAITGGASLTNEDELNASPRYYGYTRPSGGHIIMRRIDAGDGTFIYDFVLGKDDAQSVTNYDNNWTNRASLVYKKAGEFKSL